MGLEAILGAGAGILGAVGQFGSSLLASRTARRNTDRTIEAQKALAEYSYAKDTEMWNAANAYNAPAAQMQRLQAAGLNPNLVYGNGSVSGNTSTQTPRYQSYNPQYNNRAIELPNMLNILSAFQDLKIKKAQTDNLAEDNRRKNIENFYLADLMGEKRMGAFYKNLQLRNLYGQSALQADYVDKAFEKSPFMQKFGSELAKTQAQTKEVRASEMLKSLEGNLMKSGVYRGDPLWLRMLIQETGLLDYARKLFNRK